MNKRETHIVQGMTRDLAVHRFNPNMVVDAKNIRITTSRDRGTLLSVTNEKGTARLTVSGYDIVGTVIGTAVINSTLILFTTENEDHIYKLTFSSNFNSAVCQPLFKGNLGFDTSHPLETLPVYETDAIQKVYWVDGKNQPRMINICRGYQTNPDVFNFNRKISGYHTMSVKKYNTGGEFPAGTIQYCFNYFDKFGQETNIVDQSPLYYLCPKDTGLPADALSTASFQITLSGLDANYDYVRLYSIVRTSENATPNVRIVGDYKINDGVRASHEDTTQDIVISEENLYWSDAYFSQRIPFSEYYTGEWESEGPTDIDIESGYIYDLSTNSYYALYLVATETPSQNSHIVIYKNGTTYTLLTDPLPFYSRSRLIKVTSSVTKKITIVDNGIIGSTIDATSLFFIGGQDIIADTMTSKDNTLFLGNIHNNVPNIGTIAVGTSNVKTQVRGTASPCAFNFNGQVIASGGGPTQGNDRFVAGEGFYDDYVDNNRSSYEIKGFKARENYRLGFIAQYNTGQWSEAVWIDDLDETFAPGRNVFYNTSQGVKWGPFYKKPGFKATIPTNVVNSLRNSGFIRVAPVVVYPQDAERKVLFQGLLTTTAFNVSDRFDNSPFAQSDWRFRSGYTWENIRGEIQCNPYGYANLYPRLNLAGEYSTEVLTNSFVNNFSSEYYRDPSILSFYSPDIEAQEDLYQADFDGLKMRIVGVSNAGFDESTGAALIPTSVIDTYLTIKSQGFDPIKSTILDYSSGAPTFLRRNVSGQPLIANRYVEGNTDLSYGGFLDAAVQEDLDTGEIERRTGDSNIYKWVTYVWHRNGSVNDQSALSSKALKAGSIRYALLDKKCISEIQYARTTFFQNSGAIEPFDATVDINTPKLFNSDQVGVAKFAAGAEDGLFYYGNIDKVITCNFKDLSGETIESGIEGRTTGYDLTNGYPIYSMGALVDDSSTSGGTSGGGRRGGSIGSREYRRDSDGRSDTALAYGKDPVSMKYKSTKHLVVGLKSSAANEIVQLGNVVNPGFQPYWKDGSCTFSNALSGKLGSTLGDFSGFYNGIFVAELYRDFNATQSVARFGGTSDEAIANNVWTRCGDSVSLITSSASSTSSSSSSSQTVSEETTRTKTTCIVSPGEVSVYMRPGTMKTFRIVEWKTRRGVSYGDLAYASWSMEAQNHIFFRNNETLNDILEVNVYAASPGVAGITLMIRDKNFPDDATHESDFEWITWAIVCREDAPEDDEQDDDTPVVPASSVTLYYREGDTYVGRYDCLKAYPFTNEDQNQIVSIYSTELESRVNLDARYDKNKGLSSNIYMRPNNFNQFNHPGYEQSNQFFTFKSLDYSRYKANHYPNMLTWSLEKKMGADVDAWTSIPLTAAHDMQGDLGEITKLTAFNDNIFAFQNRGVAQILFNSRVQIPASDGQPIEITNGLKFGGLRYLSNQIGLTNKWSLKETPHAVYFIDDESNTLYQFNGQQFQDLSTKNGFRTWLSDVNSYTVWNPAEYGNIRTFYDKVNQDVYFTTKDDALVYSEQLGTFTSFMDYGGIPDLVNVNDRTLTFKTHSASHAVTVWKLFEGEYNMFFGEFKPYWMTFISNTDPTMDKVYDNLAWRTFDYSDIITDTEKTLQPLRTFDTLRVWNDHQDTGEVPLYDNINKPSSLKKKFNVFRALVPRDKKGIWGGKGMNRIRNTWTYIQLARYLPNTDLLVFSDLDVDFFE